MHLKCTMHERRCLFNERTGSVLHRSNGSRCESETLQLGQKVDWYTGRRTEVPYLIDLRVFRRGNLPQRESRFA